MEGYGLPAGTQIFYGSPGFPRWVYQLADAFRLKASTYPGHQESDRGNEAGFAPNHGRLNRGIDWTGSVPDMQRFADYLMSVRTSLEQVIFQNPNTGIRRGVAGGKDVSSSSYYESDYAGHRDHVHSRQSKPIPLPASLDKPSSPAPYTPDNIALGIIAEGRRARTDGPDYLQHPVMSARGIVIALATGIVESNLKMYASHADPESLNYPHEAIGSDANSVGVFQQRAPWWGTVADRMDVARSAAMFYSKLAKLDYNNPANTPGSQAQAVQRSAYPGRYDEKMPQAQAIYDRLSTVPAAQPVLVSSVTQAAIAPPKFVEINMMYGGGASSRSRSPINFFLHTQEGDGTAEGLARYCDGSNGVSYHYTVRDGIVCDVVDTDYYSWSVLDANVFSINLCFAGSFAGWSRSRWLERERDIEIAAYLAVQDCRKYNFSTSVLAPPYRRGPGISDHKYVTQCLRIGTHTDVGSGFPWDVFTRYVNKYVAAGTITLTPDVGESMATVPQDQWDRVYREITQRLPSRSPLRHLGEGTVDTWAGMTLNTDGNLHLLSVKMLAEVGDYPALELLAEVAGADTVRFPDRSRDASLAQAILADIEANRPHVIRNYLAEKES